MNILCLPDFVGHPICYSTLSKALKGQAQLHMLNYSDIWPYDSVDELAEKIVDELDVGQYDLLVGYSFGAHVAALCASYVQMARLCLIDPPPLANLRGLTLDSIEQRLAGDLRYAYVQDLVDAELVDPHCVHGNILQLSRLGHAPRVDAPMDILLCASSSEAAVRGDYPQPQRFWHDNECDHAGIVSSSKLMQIIVQRT